MDFSARTDCLANGANERLAGNRLAQQDGIIDCPGFLGTCLVFNCGDKDGWNPDVQTGQLARKIEAGHATHLNVQHQALDWPGGNGLQERFGGMVNDGAETRCPQQPANGPRKAFVVIHHRDLDLAFTQFK